MNRDFRLKRKYLFSAAIVMVLAAGIYFIGCASSVLPEGAYFASTVTAADMPDVAGKAAAPAPATPPVLPGKESENDSRLRIYTGELTLTVGNYDYAVAAVSVLTKENGGYFEVSQNDLLIIRVPAKNFQRLVDRLSSVGEVSNKSIVVLDVTDEFCDLEAKLKNLAAVRERLKSLLEKSNTIKDTINIENELNRVQTEIDQLAGRIERLRRQIAYAKLTIRLVTPGTLPVSRQVRNFTPAYWINNLGLETLYR